ncbi:MAG: hypothetical protein ACK2UO_06335 [Caldilineaceae bacterium]
MSVVERDDVISTPVEIMDLVPLGFALAQGLDALQLAPTKAAEKERKTNVALWMGVVASIVHDNAVAGPRRILLDLRQSGDGRIVHTATACR